MPDIAILSCSPYLDPVAEGDWYHANIVKEEALVIDALAAHGLSAARYDWADPSIDWSQFRAAVLRTTWDYFHRYAEFSAWLDRAGAQTQLINNLPLLRWNVDKHYLLDLAAKGVGVVPTEVCEAGESLDLASLMQQKNWSEIVFKPAVSGAARLTYRVNLQNVAEHQRIFNECVANEAMLVQPFQPAVLAAGELSLIVLDGRYSHAIRKTPKAGDFRVQDDHGGTVHEYTPTAAEITFAEAATAACPSLPAYARVDMINGTDGPLIMELEMIEPELFFRFHPGGTGALAAAIARQLGAV